MALEHDKVRFFHTFGFLTLPGQFSLREVERISAAADLVFAEDCQDRPYTGVERQQIQGFAERSRVITALIEDTRVFGLVQQLLGPELIWIGSDGNRYIGDTGWHPDGSNLSFRRIKVAFYLDSLTRESGALRVIPGSHQDPLHHALKPLLQRDDATITPYGVRASARADPSRSGFGVSSKGVPFHAVETGPGDVVFFDQNLWHASFGGRPGRRMFTLNYGARPTNAALWAYFAQMYHGQLDHVRNRQFGKRNSVYGSDFLGQPGLHLPSLTEGFRDRGFL
jgi:hypothetical protein